MSQIPNDLSVIKPYDEINIDGSKSIKYDKKLPALFHTGNLKKIENSLVEVIFGQLKDRDGLVTISFSDLALLADYAKKDAKTGKKRPKLGKEFNSIMEELVPKLKGISYVNVLDHEVTEDGFIKDREFISLFSPTTRLNLDMGFIQLQLSDEEIPAGEYIDENGETQQRIIKIKDLFNSSQWSTETRGFTGFIEYGREIHNALSTVAGQDLFRFLTGYRNTGYVTVKADFFEKVVLNLDTEAKLKTKSQYLNKALKDINSLKDQDGEQIVQNLKVEKIKKGRNIVRYIFTFKPFTRDLDTIESINGKEVHFSDNEQAKMNARLNGDYKLVLSEFRKVFGKKTKSDNYYNHKQLKEFTKELGPDLVIEALARTAANGKNFGWTRGVLRNWVAAGYHSLEDMMQGQTRTVDTNIENDNNINNAQPSTPKKNANTNVPDWVPGKIDFTPEQKAIVGLFDDLQAKEVFDDADYRLESSFLALIKDFYVEGQHPYINLSTHKDRLALKERKNI